ncbi:multiple inositol polyphosphate phosphatase 1-like isoform X2 [Penaeus japonicus]|uniref:multiple inositol polyphosphate phosphatase 1-like isoform X2 n=1 Tax=Penaeus japonicus TaxID=27405 RepID=UPI001C70E97B|nr:multiple inositol polyphosphate phosphatase 1-like isoform X2 [Penaeus japonicus]
MSRWKLAFLLLAATTLTTKVYRADSDLEAKSNTSKPMTTHPFEGDADEEGGSSEVKSEVFSDDFGHCALGMESPCADDDEGGEWASEGYCFTKEPKPPVGFAAMTPYSAALTRYLSAGSVTPEGLLCAEDLALIREWTPQMMDMGKTGVLTPEGRAEIRGIASRFKDVFQKLVYKPYFFEKSPSENARQRPGEGTEISFAPSFSSYDSAVTYLETLYGRRWGHVGLPVIGSPKLQYFDLCSNYINKVVARSKMRKPFHTFIKGKIMEAVLRRVSRRLGVTMTITRVRTMYNACQYQNAWNPKVPSPWCAAFTPRDLEVLEHWEDLRIYHDLGYAHSITYKQACGLGSDFFSRFRNHVENNKTDIDSTTYFANLEATVPFLTLLGLFNDTEPLNDKVVNRDRQWKTSRFAGYGSNLAMVLSSCRDKSWWVSALLNEESIKLPGCEDPLGCPWDKFMEQFAYLEKCNFTRLCGEITRRLWHTQYWRTHYVINNWM